MIGLESQETKAKLNTILVFETEASGVQHCFCTEAEGTERLRKATTVGSGGFMFSNEQLDAAAVYAVSPKLRERVEEAKRELKYEMNIRDALNRHGVPNDRDLRVKIKKAFVELREAVHLSVF